MAERTPSDVPKSAGGIQTLVVQPDPFSVFILAPHSGCSGTVRARHQTAPRRTDVVLLDRTRVEIPPGDVAESCNSNFKSVSAEIETETAKGV